MKKIITGFFLAGFLIFSLPTTIADFEPEKSEKELIQEYIHAYSSKYNISAKTLSRVISCESQGNPRAINYNDGGKGKHSVGILQYQKTTFDLWEKKLGEDLDYHSYHDQIKLGSYMLSKNQGRQWTCFRNLS